VWRQSIKDHERTCGCVLSFQLLDQLTDLNEIYCDIMTSRGHKPCIAPTRERLSCQCCKHIDISMFRPTRRAKCCPTFCCCQTPFEASGLYEECPGDACTVKTDEQREQLPPPHTHTVMVLQSHSAGMCTFKDLHIFHIARLTKC
jgi:hypothetical protein